jgi:LacI family transcriptional regulator
MVALAELALPNDSGYPDFRPRLIGPSEGEEMVTSRDVARVAGVSQATVSRVLHNDPRVGVERRHRVLEALKSTGFVANTHARAMKTRRTGTIGVVAGGITNPFYPELIDSIAKALYVSNQQMVLWTSGESGEPAAVEAIRSGAVDGVIFTTATDESDALSAALTKGAPIVLVNRSIEGAPCDQVTSDNALGGRLVARHFLQGGHRRVAVVGGDSTISTGRERRAGFLAHLKEAGVSIAEGMTPEATFTHAAGREAGLSILQSPSRPTAIFCVNDLLAFGVLDAATEIGISVPSQLWVAGYDDVEMASWRAFDLTTIRQPTDEMARVVVGLLLRRLGESSVPIAHQRFGTELIVRGSTAGGP